MKTLHKRQVEEGMKTFKYLPIVALCVFGLLGIAACKHETTGPEIEEVVFPRLKIISTENDGNMDFVLTPISENVKLQQQSWGDHSNDDVRDPWYEKCEIKDADDNLIGSGQVKVRGNWTTTYPKKSLRIKFDSKQSMLGLNNNKKFKNWVLLALYKDPSFLRDAVAFEMYHKLFSGYASDSKLVELEVNGTYMGVYLLAEQQEAKRLGLTEPEKNATNTDIGYLLEFDTYYSFEAENEQFEIDYLGDDIKDYNGDVMQNLNRGYTIKSDITNVAQHDFIRDYMNRLWEICYRAVYEKKYYKFNSSFELEEWADIPGADDNEKCRNCVQAVIDLGSLADTYVFNELVCDPDLYYSSFFMSLDFADGKERKLTFSAPWDFDSTMGNKSFCIADTSNEEGKPYVRNINEMHAGLGQSNVNCDEPFTHANPWMVIFINQPWFQEMVKASWAGAKAKNVLPELLQFIDAHSTDALQVAYNATRNNELWENADEGWKWELCTASKNAEAVSQKASADYLKEWLTARFSAVDSIITNMSTH